MAGKQVYELRKAIEANSLQEIFKCKYKVVAIRDSSNIYKELEGFKQYFINEDNRKITHNLSEDNSFVSYGTEFYEQHKAVYIKVRMNGKNIGICCADNLVDKQSYKDKVRALSFEEFNDFVEFLNENKIRYTVAGSYFKRFLKYAPQPIIWNKKQDTYFSDSIKSILDNGIYKYGLLLTKDNYKYPKVYSYDINSAYPAGLRKYGVVKGAYTIRKFQYTEILHESYGNIYFGVFKITDGQVKPNKTPFQGMPNERRISTGIYYSNYKGCKTFEDFKKDNYLGVVTSIDIDYLKENYDNLKYEFIEGYVVDFYTSPEIENFINELYAQKQSSTGLKGKVVKLGCNGLIGCFSYDDKKDNYLLKISHLFILTYVRDYMRKTINKITEMGYQFIGCDTDSIKTDMPVEVFKLIAPYGSELGQFKLEHEFTNFYQYQTKQYCGFENGELVTVCAGDPEYNLRVLKNKYQLAYVG